MRQFFFYILIGNLFFLSSCEETTGGTKESVPPVVPSLSAIQVSFEGLSLNEKTSNNTQIAYNAARQTASVVDFLQQFELSIVRGTLTLAGGQDPELIADSEWEWKVVIDDENEQAVQTRVIAVVGENDVQWDVFTKSSVPGFPDIELEFKVLSGTSSFDGNNGVWRVVNDFRESTDATIEWEVTDSVSTIDAQFFPFAQTSPHTTISYTSRGSSKSMDYSNTTVGDVFISWDDRQRSGFIIQSNLNNGEMFCWDSSYNDIACPN